MIRRVVLIGPECTGKTRLATDLSLYYNVPCSPEFARIFVDEQQRPIEYADVEAIGRGQMSAEDHILADVRDLGAKSLFVIHDTDLVSTLVYSRHYYGNCPAEIALEARRRLADLYLLHDVDVPWAADGCQRVQPERRNELFALFASTLSEFGVRTVLISGTWSERRLRAISAINLVVN